MKRDEIIDRIIESMAYDGRHDFVPLYERFGDHDEEGFSDAQECLDEMVHDGLVDSQYYTRPNKKEKDMLILGDSGYSVQLTIKGKRVKREGGWIKYLKRQEKPISERKWFAFTGWAFGLAASIVAVAQYIWPPQNKPSQIELMQFIKDNPPQFGLTCSAYYPGNPDPVLADLGLADSVGITGSYRLTNTGETIIKLERLDIPVVFSQLGYYTDDFISLPYSLSPNESIVVPCKLPGQERPIEETEAALKDDVTIVCTYNGADLKYSYRFQWSNGAFKGTAKLIEQFE